MSLTSATNAIQRLSLNPIMVAGHMTSIAQDLSKLAAEDEASAQVRAKEVMTALCEAYGFNPNTQSKPFAFQDGLAVIPVHGTLLNRFGACYGYVTGYSFLRRQREAAMQDPDVKHIIYDCNSGGGEAAGCMEFAQESFEMRGIKPSTAIVDSNCYSACFAIASGCDQIIVTPSGGAGSIGVLSMHVDVSKMLDNFGVKITLLHKGDHKVQGNPFEELSDDARASIEASIGHTYDRFTTLVAQNRNMDVKTVIDTQARCYNADAALELGLIDGVASPMEAIRVILSGGSTSTTETGENLMPFTPEEQAEVQKAERDRISAITTCEHATGRSKLANHLAFNTSMSAADATAILSASATEAAVAPVVTTAATTTAATTTAPAVTTTTAAATTNFQTAMDQGDHPNVGADAAASGQDAEKDQADELMSAYSAQTGYKFDKK